VIECWKETIEPGEDKSSRQKKCPVFNNIRSQQQVFFGHAGYGVYRSYNEFIFDHVGYECLTCPEESGMF
jgi:hypothetical protein